MRRGIRNTWGTLKTKSCSRTLKCVSWLPPAVRSTCTGAAARGRSYNQSPSCAGAEPLPVMDFQLPVYQTHKKSLIWCVCYIMICFISNNYKTNSKHKVRYSTDNSQFLNIVVSKLFPNRVAEIWKLQLFLCDSRCYLSVFQRPQVQQVNVARQRRAHGQEGAELGQLAVTGGDHGERRVAEGERGQVSEQWEMFNCGSSHFLSWTNATKNERIEHLVLLNKSDICKWCRH